jgi:hypothetical protein
VPIRGAGRVVVGVRWIRIWTEETVTGTTFQELDAAQRGIWFSLLVLAGRGPREGIVELRKGTGYAVEHLAQLLNVDLDLILPAISRLLEVKKVSLLPKNEPFPPKTIRLKIRNWGKYQTEYQRYRKGRTGKELGIGYASDTFLDSPPSDRLDVPPAQSKREIKNENESKKIPSGSTDVDPAGFAAFWNSTKTLPLIKDMTPERRRKLALRMRLAAFRDSWKEAVEALAQDPWYLGENDSRWRATVDWFLKNDTNWVKAWERRLSSGVRVQHTREQIEAQEKAIMERAEEEAREREASLSPEAKHFVELIGDKGIVREGGNGSDERR